MENIQGFLKKNVTATNNGYLHLHVFAVNNWCSLNIDKFNVISFSRNANSIGSKYKISHVNSIKKLGVYFD